MIKLFTLDTDAFKDNDLFCRWYFELSSVRQRNIDQCPARSDKNRSIGAGILLDYGLNTVYGLRERDMQMQIGEFGKPYFSNAPEIKYSLSHEGNKILLALSDRNIGCDITLDWQGSLDEMRIETQLHPTEIKALNALPTEERQNELLSRFWALKESFGKAIGAGINLPLNSFWFDPDGDTPEIHQNYFQGGWYFKTFRLIPNYYAAVCSEEDCAELKLMFVNASEVL